MLFPIIEKLLTPDVSDLLNAKFIQIKESCDLTKINHGVNIDNIDISDLNSDDVLKEKNMLESIAKLSINLMNDFEYFQQFMFESEYHSELYKELIKKLGYECVDDRWRSVRRPDQSDVQYNVFMYCCYRLISERMQSEIADRVEIIDECDCNAEIIISEELIPYVNEYEINEPLSNNVESVQDDNESKWKCAMCDSLNEYSRSCCEVCQEEHSPGIWQCRQCQIDNSGPDGVCSGCGTVNTNLTVSNVNESTNPTGTLMRPTIEESISEPFIDNSAVHDETNLPDLSKQWECNKCDLFLSYEMLICSRCNGDRNNVGIWRCSQCTLINKCTSKRCTLCDYPNTALGKLCKKCSRNLCQDNKDRCDTCLKSFSFYTDSNDKWRCLFSYCRTWNLNTEEYCNKCNLSSRGSYIRGNLIMQRCPDGDRNVWICEKCHQPNDPGNPICPRCNDTRYKINYCYNCSNYNDGKSLSCHRCHRRL